MSVPAALPALAVLLGAAAGTLLDDLPILPAVVLLALSWCIALAALLARRRALLLAAVAAIFFSAALALAIDAARDAKAPPLRAAVARLGDEAGAGRDGAPTRRQGGSSLPSGPVAIEGRVRDDAAPGGNGVGLTIDVERVRRGPVTERASGGVRLTVGGTIGFAKAGEWCAGRLVRVPALLREPGSYLDPGVPDGRLALARRGIALVGGVKSGALVEVRARGGWASELAAWLRRLERAVIASYVGRYGQQSAAIVIAILIGDRVGLDPEVQRQLQEAGTYHVIAISGGNIAILAGAMLWLFRVARAGHRTGSWLTMLTLTGYACLVGGGASVVRATLMAVTYLIARQADHRSAPLNALAASCTIILLATPQSVVDVAFWLTFGATFGILVGVGLVGTRLPRSRWLAVPLALLLTSVCAELSLFPVSARVFSRVTFAGLALNFLAIPLMSVAQIAGMLVLPLSLVSDAAASLAGYVAYLGAEGLVRSASLVELAPWLTYRLPPPHWLPMAGYYGAWGAWFVMRRWPAPGTRLFRRRRLLRAGALGVAAACGLWILIEPVTLIAPGVSGRLRMVVLDVGHADAILVQLPDRRSLLVDAAGSTGGSAFDIGNRVVAPALWALGTRRLDLLVLSHGDPDHIGGAAAVIRAFRPREIWEGVPVPRHQGLQALRQQAAAAGSPWRTRYAGDAARFGEVTVRVLHPPPPDWERPRVRNDDSLVLELQFRDVSVVLAGDIGVEVERTLVGRFSPARLRVLKVPHHGSATSSSAEFVSALAPHVALISAGPTTKVGEEVLQRYRDVGAAIFRTDLDGAITLETDGRRLEVHTCGDQMAGSAK